MKVAIVLAVAVLAVAFAKPAADVVVPVPRTISSEFDQRPEGAYNYQFETDNGISRQEVAEVRTIKDAEGKDKEILAVRGFYTYFDAVNGQQIRVDYTADENGYNAEGAHIPKPARK